MLVNFITVAVIFLIRMEDLRALTLALLVAFAIAGITLYVLQFFQPKKMTYSYEEISSMTKEELIQLVLENQRESGGPGKLVFPISVVLAAVLAAAISFKMCKRASIDKRILPYLLRPEERKIVELLVDHNGEMKQAELVALSKLNKVKVHRILRQMEQRGLIETVRVSKYNIVRLNKEVLRVF